MELHHVAEFRVRSEDPSLVGQAINGTIEFTCEGLPIGDLRIWAVAASDVPESDAITSEAFGAMHQTIFPSYAREDEDFVRRLEHAYSLISVEYLRDVSHLRSGDEWRRRLCELIDRADVFQLCWSKAARRSGEVEGEWRYALNADRQDFIQPIYWEDGPLRIPQELAHLHFKYWEAFP